MQTVMQMIMIIIHAPLAYREAAVYTVHLSSVKCSGGYKGGMGVSSLLYSDDLNISGINYMVSRVLYISDYMDVGAHMHR